MGLSVSLWLETDKGFRAGSYSGFHLWRKALANCVGINLDVMSGFVKPEDVRGLPWTEKEPFYELLNHSDCDRNLWFDECQELLEDFNKYRDDFVSSLSEEQKNYAYYIEKYDDWHQLIGDCVEQEGIIRFG